MGLWAKTTEDGEISDDRVIRTAPLFLISHQTFNLWPIRLETLKSK
jgi:hypothetical protein